MSFQESFDDLANKCKDYQKRVDKYKWWYKAPFQERYIVVNKILQVHQDSKLHLEAIEAGEQVLPGGQSLTPARRLFYDLQEVVPPFLASGCKAYYYLQRYRIDCTHLLKTFSYSTYKGDWEKSRELITWMGEINDKQEQYNASGSLNQSIEDLKNLGDFSNLSDADLRALEEEVRNVQALLSDNEDLLDSFSAEDLAFINEASAHLESNQHKLKGLPEVDTSFKYEEPPAIEALSYRSHQLAVLVDNFKRDNDANQPILDIDQFKRDLKSSFDLTVDVCADVYRALMEAFGAYKDFDLKKLCDTLHDVFERFGNDDYLFKRYPKGVGARHMQVHRGIPDTITMETYLMLAIGFL
jgi:hypothetical protein